MKLPQRQVDDPRAQENFEAISKFMPGFAGKAMEVRVGGASGTWPGATPRANDTLVTHGLTRNGLAVTPLIVLATVTSSPSGTWFPVVATINYTLTGFNITAVTSDGSSPVAATSYSVAWLAIG